MKNKILKHALKIYKKNPLDLKNSFVAKQIGIANATVHYHFKDALRDAVLDYAVEKDDSVVIVELIAKDDKRVKNMSLKQKQKHLKSIL